MANTRIILTEKRLKKLISESVKNNIGQIKNTYNFGHTTKRTPNENRLYESIKSVVKGILTENPAALAAVADVAAGSAATGAASGATGAGAASTGATASTAAGSGAASSSSIGGSTSSSSGMSVSDALDLADTVNSLTSSNDSDETNESIIRNSVHKAIRHFLKESLSSNEWYEEEDYNGETGHEGQVRSYEGSYYVWDFENMAKDWGYENWEDAFKYWWSEVKYEHPWYWHDDESKYATTLFVCDGDTVEDIGADQIVITQYPPFN